MHKQEKNHYKVMVCQKIVGYVKVMATDEDEALELAEDEGGFVVVNQWDEYGWQGGDGPGVRLINADGKIAYEDYLPDGKDWKFNP